MSSRSKRYLKRSGLKHAARESRVGAEFQADVPVLIVKEVIDFKPFEMERMLWNPSILPPETVQNYLEYMRMYGWRGLNEERALFLLHKCNYDTEEALRRFKLLPVTSVRDTSWSEEECNNFDCGLAKHGKDFRCLQKAVLTRSVQEIVQYYYSWKKSERYDTFIKNVSKFQNSRFRKKTFKKVYRAMDYADFFLEQELAEMQEKVSKT